MKPVSIERMEFIESITKMVNEARLPLFVIEPILKDIYLRVAELAEKQYQHDLKTYNDQIKAAMAASECANAAEEK